MYLNSMMETQSLHVRSTHALFLGNPMSMRDCKAEDILCLKYSMYARDFPQFHTYCNNDVSLVIHIINMAV